jgi:hypothetical protein
MIDLVPIEKEMPFSSGDIKEGAMKRSNKEVREEKKYDTRYLTCPRCGTIVSYERRGKHHCFRQHLTEVERDIARMGWANRAR